MCLVSVGSQVGSQVGSGLNNNRGGSLWSGWVAYVSFIRDVLCWEDPILDRFEIDEDLARSCGWVWWHENVLAISDRPSEIHRDDEGRLHCETGPSIAYRDGWSLYHWHGVSVPSEWITNHASVTPKMALTWENIEQRRAAIEIVGWDKIIDQLNAKVIDEDVDPEIGTLIEAKIPDIGKERFLRVRCGTGRSFCLPVPPNMKTALEAQSWTWGLDEKTFKKPEVRT